MQKMSYAVHGKIFFSFICKHLVTVLLIARKTTSQDFVNMNERRFEGTLTERHSNNRNDLQNAMEYNTQFPVNSTSKELSSDQFTGTEKMIQDGIRDSAKHLALNYFRSEKSFIDLLKYATNITKYGFPIKRGSENLLLTLNRGMKQSRRKKYKKFNKGQTERKSFQSNESFNRFPSSDSLSTFNLSGEMNSSFMDITFINSIQLSNRKVDYHGLHSKQWKRFTDFKKPYMPQLATTWRKRSKRMVSIPSNSVTTRWEEHNDDSLAERDLDKSLENNSNAGYIIGNDSYPPDVENETLDINITTSIDDEIKFTNENITAKENRMDIMMFNKLYPVKIWQQQGFYKSSYVYSINRHWLQFYPPSPLLHKFLAILYGILMTVGCGGNLLVIYMFFRCKSLRTPPNFLIVNLAISDFLMMVKMPIFIYNSLLLGPALGNIGCKIYGFLGGLTGTASIMSLTAIAYDRYQVITFPLNPSKRTTKKSAYVLILLIWLYSIVFSGAPLVGISDYVPEGYLTSCSFDYLDNQVSTRLFIFVFFIFAFLLPISLICFSYSRVFFIVQKAEKFYTEGGVKGNRESFRSKRHKEKCRAELKVARVSAIVVGLWLISWTPYAIVALLGILGQKDYITPFTSMIPALFCKSVSCINPFIYSISHPKFKRELEIKFRMFFPRLQGSHINYDNSNSFTRQHMPPTCHGSFEDTTNDNVEETSFVDSNLKSKIFLSVSSAADDSGTFRSERLNFFSKSLKNKVPDSEKGTGKQRMLRAKSFTNSQRSSYYPKNQQTITSTERKKSVSFPSRNKNLDSKTSTGGTPLGSKKNVTPLVVSKEELEESVKSHCETDSHEGIKGKQKVKKIDTENPKGKPVSAFQSDFNGFKADNKFKVESSSRDGIEIFIFNPTDKTLIEENQLMPNIHQAEYSSD